jgi:glycerol-3-phosphate dehydrogenase
MDIRSVFAGLRPLVKASGEKTAELSRDHLITVSDSALITITGGKWTTYRRMAEDVINVAIEKSALTDNKCITSTLKIHGAAETDDFNAPLYYFGSDKEKIRSLIEKDKTLGELIHPKLPYIKAEIIWAVQNEMCMTVEDALARRTRALLLDAHAAIESAPAVALLMAKELNMDETWIKEQVDSFNKVAKNYLPGGN